MYTVKEVATQLNLSQGAIYKAIRSGQLDHFRFGSSIRITQEQLDAYLELSKVDADEVRFPIRRFKHL